MHATLSLLALSLFGSTLAATSSSSRTSLVLSRSAKPTTSLGLARSTRTATTSSSTSSSSTISSSTVASASPTPTWYKPKTGTTFLWSLDEAIPANPVSDCGLELHADVYGVDLFDSTQAQIDAYHKAGKKVVCYFSAGSFETGRPDSANITPSCYCNKSSQCKMEGWPEYWLDLHTPSCVSNIQGVMAKRIALAKTKGCDAVEADNEDAYDNKSGWSISIAEELSYLLFLSKTAHDAGLGIGLKNSPRMITEKPEIVKQTDFVIIEECATYNECDAYKPYITAGKAAWSVEYETTITCSVPGLYVLSYSSYDVDYKNVDDVCYRAV